MSAVGSARRGGLTSASIVWGGMFAWKSRIVDDQPVSTRSRVSPELITCDGPKRCGTCTGLPVPRSVSSSDMRVSLVESVLCVDAREPIAIGFAGAHLRVDLVEEPGSDGRREDDQRVRGRVAEDAPGMRHALRRLHVLSGCGGELLAADLELK